MQRQTDVKQLHGRQLERVVLKVPLLQSMRLYIHIEKQIRVEMKEAFRKMTSWRLPGDFFN